MNALLLNLADDDQAPAAKDVVAGWTGFAVFLALIVVVALLCWSMVRQLRKAQAAKDAGVYGDPPAADAPESGPDAAPTSGPAESSDAAGSASPGEAPADRGSDA